MSAPFRWGVLSPGRIAHKFAQALEVVNDAVVYATASTEIDKARSFADLYAAPCAYDEYEAVLEDPDVDAVYIASTHNFHHAQARLALEAGKPVLCEKPLTVNADESMELIELARDKGVFLMEALWSRYLPIYSQVRDWLDSGAVGEVVTLQSTFGFKPEYDPKGRVWNPDLAGGALLDIGIYNIAISQWVLGQDPSEFSVASQIAETGVDEVDAVNLLYENDVVSQFICSIRNPLDNDFHISGTEGSIKIHGQFWNSEKASLTQKGESETVEMPYFQNGFEYQIVEAQRCIEEGLLETPGMTHADTLANMELMDAIRSQVGVKYPFE